MNKRKARSVPAEKYRDELPRKILFVINTLGQGGAEIAMIRLMETLMSRIPCEIHLQVMLGQGELIDCVPKTVKLLNRHYDPQDVLSVNGRKALYRHVAVRLLRGASGLRNLPYILDNYLRMRRTAPVPLKNLLWKAIADGTAPPKESYDLAIAFLEGAATYYTAERVSACKKAAFLHIDYQKAGYTTRLDHGCYALFDRVFCVSPDVKSAFLTTYPELEDRTVVFRNILDRERILRCAKEKGGFDDGYEGLRIVSLGRLVKQKAFDTAVWAARKLLERGYEVHWYVFGEGEERAALEHEIRKLGLEDSFFLMGVKRNPFPYLRQAQIYVQCSRYEGQSIAVREAKILGLPVVLSRTSGNRDQITDGVDGIYVGQNAEDLADGIERLIRDPELRFQIGLAAAQADQEQEDIRGLLELLKG